MKVGTKSILFGVHCFFWHPITVALAWRKLYDRWPRGWEWLAILLHDIGYWGCPNIDGPEGEKHPILGANLVWKIVFCFELFFRRSNEGAEFKASRLAALTVLHSRYFAAKVGARPSNLCWADKLSVWFDPSWFYLLRARLSGEIKEYRQNAVTKIHLDTPDEFWLVWYRNKVLDQVTQRLPAQSRNHVDS